MPLPEKVKIVEVGPRDGLQNEKQLVDVDTRIELINKLADAGVSVIEAGSFVSAKWVPQMADTDKVMAGISRKANIVYPVLVPNMQGLNAAIAADVEEIAVFAAASQSFSKKNINCSIEESLERFRPVCESALERGLRVRGYVSCVMGCPYEGDINLNVVADVAQKLQHMGCYEISLGDTIGVGTPDKAGHMLETVAEKVGMEKLAIHFHDTYGQALANIYACLQLGVAVIDSAVAGLGGCPYASGASGNVATEDVIYMLDGLGIETGIDLRRLIDTAWYISGQLQRQPAAKVSRALKIPS